MKNKQNIRENLMGSLPFILVLVFALMFFYHGIANISVGKQAHSRGGSVSESSGVVQQGIITSEGSHRNCDQTVDQHLVQVDWRYLALFILSLLILVIVCLTIWPKTIHIHPERHSFPFTPDDQ
ncbi:MAG: hypothetical protein JJ975_15920 [Bacteroidia bacterium]|nr:hypothetical protein [Bacteroidia bacterium]